MSFPEIEANHFDGHSNLTQAQKRGEGPTLAEFVGRFKSGFVTAAGIGDEVVAFGSAFPDANIAVVLGPGSTSGGTVKDGTIAAGGFTITAAGAGIIGWTATYIGA